jgi:glycosyltransferase involved in cell wall biosynthesis
MRIAFNFHGCNAGNNGGTQTAFRSAIALTRLGVEVELWSNRPNGYTWQKLPPEVPFIVKKSIEDHNPVDVLIALGAGSVKSTVQFAKKKVGLYWIRGFETWGHSRKSLIRGYQSGLKLMANSNWLRHHVTLLSGVPCRLVRPGIEVGFFDRPPAKLVEPIVIGSLFSSSVHKRPAMLRRVIKRVKERCHSDVAFHMLANRRPPAGIGCDHVFLQPSMKKKLEMYQRVNIWFSPSVSEGLHIPPMEAGLCGAALVANKEPSGGMRDYANDSTARLFTQDDPDEAAACIISLINDTEQRVRLAINLRQHILTEIGSREANMRILLFNVIESELS